MEQETDNHQVHVVVAWVVACFTLLYMLPWAVAATRRHDYTVVIALVTFFLALPTLGLAWVACLIWAFIDPAPAQPANQTITVNYEKGN